jgi:hypothetical protein
METVGAAALVADISFIVRWIRWSEPRLAGFAASAFMARKPREQPF